VSCRRPGIHPGVVVRFRLKLKRLDFISAVDAGAQGPIADVALIKRHDASGIEAVCEVVKVDESLGLVFGWALATSLDGGKTPHVDLQSDAIDEADLIKVAAEFMEDAAKSDVMHDFENDGRIVFAMPLVPEVNNALGIKSDVHGLAIAMKPSPATFKRFQSGELRAFSIAGIGERELLTEKRVTDEKRAPSAIDARAVAASLTRKSPPSNTARKVEPKMTEEQYKARIAELEAELAALKEKPAEKRLVVLTEAQQSHYAKLHGDDAAAFIAKSDSERTAIVKAAIEADPIEYTTADGLVLRKSADPALIAMAKKADSAEKLAKAERDARELVELTKRASETLGAIAGTPATHAALLKSVESIADETTRNAAIASLKAANAVMLEKGVAKGVGGEEKDLIAAGPQGEFDGLVAKHMTDHKCDERDARLAVVKTARGRELYAAIEKAKRA
jgi:hypothetical protein